MNRPERTRLALPGVFAAILLVSAACQRAETTAPPATSAPPTTSAPAATRAPVAPVSVPQTPEASAAPVTTAAAPPPAVSSVLIIGDSLSDETAGGGGFVKLLRQRCPAVRFDNRAKGGHMVNQMRRRLEAEVLPEGGRYSHAIVFGGVNDLYSDQSASRTLPRIQADLTRIYDGLRQRGVHTIAITVAPWGGFRRWYTAERGRNTLALNAWILQQVESGRVSEALDAYPLLSCGDPELLCPELAAPHKDGLHLGKLGHAKLADALAQTALRTCAAN